MPNTILTGGEKYSELISKRLGGSKNEPQVTFQKARDRLISDIANTRKMVDDLPRTMKLPTEFVVCVRMNPKYSAKSYFPKSVFNVASQNKVEAIGSRNWYPDKEESNPGKLIFARTTDSGLSTLEGFLLSSNHFTDQFSMEVRRIEKVDLLGYEEKLLGFEDDWQEGYVEFVFHPFDRDRDQVISAFKQIQNFERLKIREYDSGIIFASAVANRESLEKVKNYNALRSIHPIQTSIGVKIRSVSSGAGPKPPIITNKNKIPVGVIDGGIDENHPYFKHVTTNEDHTSASNDSRCNQHGTWVTGMLLYGNLNQYGLSDTLPEPNFFVKSFRVLPQGNSGHSESEKDELYDIIDEIEKIVPDNPEIRVYNLSLGPSGPIYDDYLTRFTYACDHLSRQHDVQFCIAAGNDGDTSNPRIQSPSDSVNSLSVGAYTLDNGAVVKADYSCVGPGREGNKLKPDLLAFGGDEKNPLQFVSTSSGKRDIGVGYTSLATPQVSSAIANLIGKYSLDPLSSKSLLLNKVYLDKEFDIEYGHGILPNNIEDVTYCGDGSFTLQYRGRLLPTKFAQLQIPWPDMTIKGKVTFTWTLVVLADTDELSTDEYTKESMEVTFYPNDSRYVFISPNKKTKVVNLEERPDLARQLLSQGWKPGNFPKSESGPSPSLGEQGLRANLKWDSVVQGKKTFRSAGSIKNPFFHLHCFAREDGAYSRQTDYCLTLSVQLHKSHQDIYTPIVERYSALVPIAETIQQKVVVKSDA